MELIHDVVFACLVAIVTTVIPQTNEKSFQPTSQILYDVRGYPDVIASARSAADAATGKRDEQGRRHVEQARRIGLRKVPSPPPPGSQRQMLACAVREAIYGTPAPRRGCRSYLSPAVMSRDLMH
jgi:hypothetical protein